LTQQTLALLGENLPNAIIITDLDGLITFVNKAAEQCTGYLRHELIGKSPIIFNNEPNADDIQQEIINCLKNSHNWRGELSQKRKDGSTYLAEVKVFSIPDEQGVPNAFASIQQNITVSKQAQKMAEIEQQRLFSVLDELPALVYLQAPDYTIRFANRYFGEHIGVSRENLHCYEIVAQGNNEPCKHCQTLKVFETGCALEYEWTSPKGRTYQMYCYPFYDIDDTMLTLVLGIDITERKQAEEKLRASEEKYRQIFKYAPAGIYEIDFVNQKFVNANDVILEYLGYTKEEFYALNPFEILTPESRKHFRNRLKNHFLGSKVPMVTEFKIRTKDGREIWSIINARFMYKNGNPVGATVVAHDITERKNLEVQLIEQKKRLEEQLLYSNALNQIAENIIINSDTNTILSNTAAIIGKTLAVDRSLIYDIDFGHYHVKGLSEWLNPESPGITPTLDTYSLDTFIGGSTFMLEHREWIESHFDCVNPQAVNDGSGEVLHNYMHIKSGLWYPFSFRDRAYYCLVFNQVMYRRTWKQDEINFLKAAARQVEIAIQKIDMQNKRDRAEKALRDNEERLRIITDNMLDMLCLTDENFIIRYASPSYKKWLGFKPTDLVGSSIFEFTHSDDLPGVMAVVNEALMTKSSGKAIFRCRHRNGSYLWIECSGSLLLDEKGNVTGTVFCSRDITASKIAEERIKESESLYRTIFENTGTATIISLEDTTIELVNTGFAKLSGYAKGEIEGEKSWIEFVLPEDLDELVKCHFDRLLEPDMVPTRFEFRFVDKLKNIRNVLMSVAPIPGTHKHVGSLLDITEIIKFQEEMTRLERLNLVGQMAAGIGHEVRNPMTTVRGFLQMFAEKKEFNANKPHFELMIEELDRANSIITQFLSLAKNKPIKKGMHDFNVIIKRLYPLIQADAFKFNMSVKLELNEIANIYADEKEICQLILNLTRNGIEAMSPGGNLTIKTFMNGENMALAIQDEGCGIKPKVLETLGTPFVTDKDNGTGLGLAVCYSVAARHNAIIHVKTDSTGTTFFVTFNK